MTALDLLKGPYLGVGLGIDVHSESPDWAKLLERNGKGPKRTSDNLTGYTRGAPGLAKQVRAAAKGLPLIYHHEGLDPVYPRAPRPEAVEAAGENMKAIDAPWC